MTAEFVIPNCAASASDAGAIMEDDTGLMKVKADTMAVAAHFRLNVQLVDGRRWLVIQFRTNSRSTRQQAHIRDN